ncbi:hypothetical protein DFH09DRAFT_1181895, partial [Mycena vulgaris]
MRAHARTSRPMPRLLSHIIYFIGPSLAATYIYTLDIHPFSSVHYIYNRIDGLRMQRPRPPALPPYPRHTRLRSFRTRTYSYSIRTSDIRTPRTPLLIVVSLRSFLLFWVFWTKVESKCIEALARLIHIVNRYLRSCLIKSFSELQYVCLPLNLPHRLGVID